MSRNIHFRGTRRVRRSVKEDTDAPVKMRNTRGSKTAVRNLRR
jgi:hypothetical protein